MTIPLIPTYFVVPPAIVALLLYMWLYYERDPVNRVTDVRFLLGVGCFFVVVAQMFVVIRRYDQRISSMALFVLALALLACAVWMVLTRPAAVFRGFR